MAQYKLTNQSIIFPNQDSHFSLNGPSGPLETSVTVPSSTTQTTIAIVCHPHPLQGGTMDNKVVTTLARTFKGLGIPSVRFNFRGVGQSVGQFDEGKGEQEDLLAIHAWVSHAQPQAHIWLAGFSFGAYVSLSAAHRINPDLLVSVAPAVNRFDTSRITHPQCPWLLIQGEQDDVVPANEVYAWAEQLNPPPQILRFPEAGHFFHGQLIALRERLEIATSPYLINPL